MHGTRHTHRMSSAARSVLRTRVRLLFPPDGPTGAPRQLFTTAWQDSLAVELDLPTRDAAPPACPICLADRPSPPVMAPCGHLYCLGCWLQFAVKSAEAPGGAGGAPPAASPPSAAGAAAALPAALAASVPCPVCGGTGDAR